MKWFRWYRDTVADVKLRTVAMRASCHTTAAIALWAAILEDASKPEHRGVCERPIDMMAVTLDLTVTQAEHMRDAMAALGMVRVKVDSIHVVKWGDRQFESDADGTARERQRRKRAKNKGKNNASVTDEAVNVTRDSSPPEDRVQNTDSEKKESTPREELLRVLDEQRADAVIEHRRKKYPLTTHAAKLLAGKFALAPDANAAADAMIANGWRGFEPEWISNRRNGHDARAGPVSGASGQHPPAYYEAFSAWVAAGKTGPKPTPEQFKQGKH